MTASKGSQKHHYQLTVTSLRPSHQRRHNTSQLNTAFSTTAHCLSWGRGITGQFSKPWSIAAFGIHYFHDKKILQNWNWSREPEKVEGVLMPATSWQNLRGVMASFHRHCGTRNLPWRQLKLHHCVDQHHCSLLEERTAHQGSFCLFPACSFLSGNDIFLPMDVLRGTQYLMKTNEIRSKLWIYSSISAVNKAACWNVCGWALASSLM